MVWLKSELWENRASAPCVFTKGGKFDKKNRRNMKTPMPLQLRGETPVDAEGRAICTGTTLEIAMTKTAREADMCAAKKDVSLLLISS